jgi:hypothetical protein
MNTPQSDDAVSPDHAGVSRRMVFGASATGLALALLARAAHPAAAQEATPAAEGGLPPGLTIDELIKGQGAAIGDMPPAPVSITMLRMTLVPGASSPASSFAFPTLGYTESGTTICPGEAGRVVYGPDGSVQASGAGDLAVPTGSSIYTPANVADGARNDGTEPTTMLMINFIPAGEMGTPTMDMGTPTS